MNLYDLLGVSPSASDAEIKKAYRRLAMEFHPDRNPDPAALAKFQEVSAAYDVLSNDTRRARYDATGATDDNNDDQQLVMYLKAIFDALVQKDGFIKTNYFKKMQGALQSERVSIQSAKNDAEKNILALEYLISKSTADPMLMGVFEIKIATFAETKDEADSALVMVDRALELLKTAQYSGKDESASSTTMYKRTRYGMHNV